MYDSTPVIVGLLCALTEHRGHLLPEVADYKERKIGIFNKNISRSKMDSVIYQSQYLFFLLQLLFKRGQGTNFFFFSKFAFGVKTPS
jgi:hypothetical protein